MKNRILIIFIIIMMNRVLFKLVIYFDVEPNSEYCR